VHVDLSRLLKHVHQDTGHCAAQRLYESPDSLATQLDGLMAGPIAKKSGGEQRFLIHNTDRSIGTRLSGAIARAHGNHGMDDAPLQLRFRGTAGQSFGAFNAGGLLMELEGEANDYVGKGLSGGRIIVRPDRTNVFPAERNVIAGNVIGYGATSGEMFLRGQVGERFMVRNSGATAVVEGIGEDFVPPNCDLSLVAEALTVTDGEALATARELLRIGVQRLVEQDAGIVAREGTTGCVRSVHAWREADDHEEAHEEVVVAHHGAKRIARRADSPATVAESCCQVGAQLVGVVRFG